MISLLCPIIYWKSLARTAKKKDRDKPKRDNRHGISKEGISMLSSEETARARYKSDKKMKMFVKRRSTETGSGIGGKAQTIYRSPEKHWSWIFSRCLLLSSKF